MPYSVFVDSYHLHGERFNGLEMVRRADALMDVGRLRVFPRSPCWMLEKQGAGGAGVPHNRPEIVAYGDVVKFRHYRSPWGEDRRSQGNLESL